MPWGIEVTQDIPKCAGGEQDVARPDPCALRVLVEKDRAADEDELREEDHGAVLELREIIDGGFVREAGEDREEAQCRGPILRAGASSGASRR